MYFKFTVFTPVYNRKEKIHRVWESLCNQSFRDFEWIVVDDGSTDNVIDLLESYKEKADFPIHIHQQKNLGKHFAWNKAVLLAKGELFVPADSDDSFDSNTLDFFNIEWNKISEKNKFSGINVLCKSPINGNIIGDRFPKSPLVSDNLELYYKYKIRGEKWGCVRTDLLKETLFPEVSGRGSYVLAYAWYSLARKYKNINYNIALRNYFLEEESITNKKLLNKYSAAYTYYHYGCWHLNTNYKYILRHSPIEFIKLLLHTLIKGFLSKKSLKNIFLDQNKTFIKVLTLFALLPAYILFIIKYKD